MRHLGLETLCRGRKVSAILISALFGMTLAFLQSGCLSLTHNHPKILASKWDVRLARSGTKEIRIPDLPIENYPLLAKFKKVKDIDFYWGGANDAKLRELSKLSFTNLQQIGLLDCPAVTDEGIRAIAYFPSIRGLQLEGTSITDTGLEVMATEMNLTGVNVANCEGVTRTGIQSLARCSSLRRLTFSADDWTQEQVIEFIGSLKQVNWCSIVDSQERLNANLVKSRGEGKGIHIVVQPRGALQTMRDYRSNQSKR